MSLFAAIADIEQKRLLAALCTVVKVSGSTPRKSGTKMIVIDNHEPFGAIIGTIGGGAIEHRIRESAILAIRKQEPLLLTTSLRNELGMCCGGEMTVFIDPLVMRPPCICFGAGHIAQALCVLLENLGFDVNIVDERNDLLNHPAFSKVSKRINDVSVFALNALPLSRETFVVVATHDHDLDQRIVESILRRESKYLALVGSQRKAHMTEKRLRAKGFTESVIKRVHCPAGIGIHARTPEEIALAIAAQMIKVKNGDDEIHCVDSSGRE